MKSLFLIIFATLLATAILTPSLVTLSNLGEKTAIAIDFNDEEKKEEKKEVSEKDYFLDSNIRLLSRLHRENASNLSFYVESEYSTSIAIFLPPPRT